MISPGFQISVVKELCLSSSPRQEFIRTILIQGLGGVFCTRYFTSPEAWLSVVALQVANSHFVYLSVCLSQVGTRLAADDTGRWGQHSSFSADLPPSPSATSF